MSVLFDFLSEIQAGKSGRSQLGGIIQTINIGQPKLTCFQNSP
jgi:hypothetical protein